MDKKNKVVTLTLMDNDGHSGLTIEASDITVEDLTTAFALGICAAAKGIDIDPFTYMTMVGVYVMDSINGESISIDLAAIEKLKGGKTER